MSALSQIDQSSFRKRVEDHISNTFGSLIPEEEFTKLVDEQIKSFFEDTREFTVKEVEIKEQGRSDYYSRVIGHKNVLNCQITPFQQMVWAIVREKALARTLDYFRTTGESEIDKVFDELFALKEFKDGQRHTVEQLMLAMSANFFYNMSRPIIDETKSKIMHAAACAGMPNLANAIGGIA